ncbi:MAG: hypothetical protein AAF571_12675 [Verrucomicrobiota bacterium]
MNHPAQRILSGLLLVIYLIAAHVLMGTILVLLILVSSVFGMMCIWFPVAITRTMQAFMTHPMAPKVTPSVGLTIRMGWIGMIMPPLICLSIPVIIG